MAESGIVFVIDDDPALCALMEAALQRVGLKVRTFLSAEAFAGVDLHAESKGLPCCLLLDLVMPGQSGLEFLERYFSGPAPCPVIMMTARGSIRDAVRSMKLGAVDFLEKPFATETLTALVLDALKACQSASALAAQREEVRIRITSLSPRERELLDFIVHGSSTKMIADRLGISARTVDHHRANLMEKMRAANVADLVRLSLLADYEKVPRADGAAGA